MNSKRFDFTQLKHFIFAIAASFGAASFANAAQVVQSPPATLDAYVVTATQNEGLLAFDSPVAVNLISQEMIVRNNVVTTHELFQNTPGIDVITSGPGAVHPVIRGLSEARVLVLVDGIRLSEERPGGSHVFSIDPAQVDRVEVIRGPSSVLYGNGAIGGVINIITKKAPMEQTPEARSSGNASLQYASASDGFRKTAHVHAGKGSLNVYAGATHNETENVKTPKGEIRFSDYEGYTAWTGGNYAKDKITTEINYWQTQGDLGIASPAAFVEDKFDGEIHRMLNGKIRAYELSDWVKEISLQASWQEHERNRIRRPNTVALVNIQVDKQTWTLRPQAVIVPHEAHRLTVGTEYWKENLSSSRRMPAGNPYDGVPVMPPSEREGLGFFAQDEFSFSEKLNFVGGIRYDSIKSKTQGSPAPYPINGAVSDSDSSVSASLGAVYALQEDTNLFANAGRAFRSPTIIERYFYGPHDGPGQDYGDPNLKPETSWSFDIGVRQQTEDYSASASVFYTRVDELIQKTLTNPTAAPAAQINQFKNLSEAELYGLELEGEYALATPISVYAWFAYTKGNDKKANRPLTNIPPFKARYGIRYEGMLESYDVWADFSALTATAQNSAGVGEKKTGGYTTLDLRTGVTFSKNWSAQFAVENILDKTYYNHLSSAYQSLNFAEAERNFKLGLNYAY